MSLPLSGAAGSPAAGYGDDLAFLRRHVAVVELTSSDGHARVAVIPAYQGRVMTTTAGGTAGRSFGWVNRGLIASGKFLPHINVFGGEDRLWLGPEGGPFALFFPPGSAQQTLENWQTPALVDTEPWRVVRQSAHEVEFSAAGRLRNRAGSTLDVGIDRTVRLLDAAEAGAILGAPIPASLSWVGFESHNRLTNRGPAAWTEKTGLPSLWVLGQFNCGPTTVAVIPVVRGDESRLGPRVRRDYFGEIPAGRLRADDGVLYFRMDGLARGKLGVSPRRARSVLGSWDAEHGVLTLVAFNLPADAAKRPYVDSRWIDTPAPYAGDAVNAYNDGPPTPGAKPLGPFYELESSSPAAALAPGGEAIQISRTFHFTGDRAALDRLARAELGVPLGHRIGLEMTEAGPTASLAGRLDRLPSSWPVWRLVLLLSLGGFFEIYDLFLTAYVSPALIHAGIFHGAAHGLFGLSDQATFAASTFAGLFFGTIGVSFLADRFGRRPIFTYSLLAYSAATILMAARHSAFGIDLFRFLAGLGIGVEMVTIDAYISELVPARMRGRAFAFNAFVQFLAVPAVALAGWLLLPRAPFGLAGWRWVVLMGATGAIVVWFLRVGLPESPRWLVRHGRSEEAARIVKGLEVETRTEGRAGAVPPPGMSLRTESKDVRGGGTAPALPSEKPPSMWQPPYRRRTIMLIVFNFFQTIGFYGFGNWLPAFLADRGASVIHSLQYSFLIALAYPLGPVIGLAFADRINPKWQIVGSALGIAAFGLAFAAQTAAGSLIAFGILISLANCVMSYSFHAYQAELFPTAMRARAVGFCYSWSRFSTIFTSFMIAFFLQNFGTPGVFAFVAVSMLVVAADIGFFGPRTRGLGLEEISG